MSLLTEEEYKLLKRIAENDSITMESMTKKDKRTLKRLIALGYAAPLSDEAKEPTSQNQFNTKANKRTKKDMEMSHEGRLIFDCLSKQIRDLDWRIEKVETAVMLSIGFAGVSAIMVVILMVQNSIK